jgi:hypothetical protein
MFGAKGALAVAAGRLGRTASERRGSADRHSTFQLDLQLDL